MSDPPLSDIDFKNKMASVCTTHKTYIYKLVFFWLNLPIVIGLRNLSDIDGYSSMQSMRVTISESVIISW